MKRDMDLVRKILLNVEAYEKADGSDWLEIRFDENSEAEIRYHITLLGEAGLLEVHDLQDLCNPRRLPTRLTWAGHEFLDAAREPSRWEKAKRVTIEKTGGLSFEALKHVLFKLLTEGLFG